MRLSAVGALLGLGLSAGVLLVSWWLSARRPERMSDRIRPHVSIGASDSAEATNASSLLAWSGLRSGRTPFGSEQLACAAGGALSAVVVALVVSASLQALALLIAIGVIGGLLLSQWQLTRQARERSRRLESQLPAAAELLAFALAAGESPHGALVRVSSGMDGVLAGEFGAVVADVRSGIGLETALRQMATRTGSAVIARFVDVMLVAIERGTPISEVMRAQAADVQAESRRRLLTVAGRKDVAMLVPVVFLILPTVVVVALFPGLQSLRMVAP